MVLFFDPDFPANDPVEHIIECELYQHVKIFPEVLCHEAEESQEGPAEAIKAGVAVVWIPPSFHTRVALGAAAEVVFRRDKTGETERRERREEKKQGTGPGMTQQLFTCHCETDTTQERGADSRILVGSEEVCRRSGTTHPESELFPHRSASSWPGRK